MSELKMLAIDLGASSGRGIVGSFDGKTLKITENHRFPNEPVNTNGNFSWDILRIFHEIKASISKCALSEDKTIQSIGIDTWGVDYGYIDKNGALMANPYHYRDSRTDGIQPYAFKTVPFEKLYGITGIQTMNFNTIYQLVADMRDRPYIVENAERFGLATLHQLRGRVGRNSLQSYCYLISDMDTPRLKVMEESNDGFYISEKDFELRGEGDLFGTRQSGDMVFKLADIRRDFRILTQCKQDASKFINDNIVDNFSNYPQFRTLIKELEFID